MATTMNPLISCPYPGLRPFESAEADIFFGRTRCVKDLLDRLLTLRFVAVTGPSGCGKSSLIRAGLLPAILSSNVDGGGDWKVAFMRPGYDSIRNLAEALMDVFRDHFEAAQLSIDAIEAKLRIGPFSLTEILAANKLAIDGTFLLLVDEFEEVFREDCEIARHGQRA